MMGDQGMVFGYRFVLGILVLLAGSSCGSEIRLGTGSGGASASSATAPGAGGLGGQAMSSNSTAASGGDPSSGSGGASLCKTWDDPVCGEQGWCQLDAPQGCAGGGVCKERPVGCDDDCPGVCGCDGKAYCNACGAHAQGIAVAHEGACSGPTYSAILWLGGLDHIVVSKKDEANKLCVRVFADWPAKMQAPYAVTMPSGWAVSNVDVSDDPSDCDDLQSPAKGNVRSSGGATGSLVWTVDPGKSYPCTLDVQMNVSLPGGPQLVSKSGITLTGGCI